MTYTYDTIAESECLRLYTLTCWIELDDYMIDVFRPPGTPETNLAKGWIQSIPGANITVNWHNSIRRIPLEGRLYMDGKHIDTHILPDKESHPWEAWDEYDVSFVQVSPKTRRCLTFANRTANAEGGQDALAKDDEWKEQIGTIRLEIRRAQMNGSVRSDRDIVFDGDNLEDRPAPGVAHSITLGDMVPENVRDALYVGGQPLDEDPWCTFIFRYRSLDFLLANDVIPEERLKEFIRPKTEPDIRDDPNRMLEYLRSRPGTVIGQPPPGSDSNPK
ncbi:hypothetical protein CPC08DRAFT_762261 [Agrocybe pediades]|nr:hypothetical protein CPC08DRAFT_762261 [Agrocybe pediades]